MGTLGYQGEGMKTYIVTVRLAEHPNHDPKNKQSGHCPVSDFCTDVTGEYHSFIMTGESSEAVRDHILNGELNQGTEFHITRIERV